MWSTLKAMPIVPKILIALLLVGGLYSAAHSQRNSYSGSSSIAEAGYRSGSDAGSSAGDQSAALAQFQSQQAQLLVQVRECQAQMTVATNRMRDAAIQGQFYNARPQCEQYMPQWIAQESYLETEIYRIQTGDHSSSVCQVTGIQGEACNTGAGASSRGSSDDGTGAVENWDRQAIRGNSIYTDEDGEQHELPTQPYYFRDRSSGQYIGSASPNPPNDGRDYEVLTGQSN
jgi:hypothetical protein